MWPCFPFLSASYLELHFLIKLVIRYSKILVCFNPVLCVLIMCKIGSSSSNTLAPFVASGSCAELIFYKAYSFLHELSVTTARFSVNTSLVIYLNVSTVLILPTPVFDIVIYQNECD